MAKSKSFVEEVELQGHIIDSLLFPKVLDRNPHPRRQLLRDAMKDSMKLGKRQIDSERLHAHRNQGRRPRNSFLRRNPRRHP